MNLDRLAGLASAIGMLLLVALAIAAAEPDFRLKDWQTLITGFMALIAASIAYWGATAKVRHDREIVETEIRRRKLALYLKIEFSFRELSGIAHEKAGGITFG